MPAPDRYRILRFVLWCLILIMAGGIVANIVGRLQDRRVVSVTGHGWEKPLRVLGQM